MSFQSAVAGFGIWCRRNGVKFDVPYVCNGIFIGEEQVDVFEAVRWGSKRATDIKYQNRDVLFSDSSGVYLKISSIGVYISSIWFNTLVSQIPEESKYTYKGSTYLSNVIIDGHMLWIKPDGELKVKPVKNVPGENISSQDLGVVIRRETKESYQREHDLWLTMRTRKGEGYNSKLYSDSNKLDALVREEAELKQKVRALEVEVNSYQKELSALPDSLAQVSSELGTLQSKYSELKERMEESVTKYGQCSAKALLREGYLRREPDGTLSFVPSSRKPDTIEQVKHEEWITVRGANPSDSSDFFWGDIYKYHKELSVWYEDKNVVDPLWLQAEEWSSHECYTSELSRLYGRITSLKFQKDVLTTQNQTFENGAKSRLNREKAGVMGDLKEAKDRLSKVQKELYGN